MKTEFITSTHKVGIYKNYPVEGGNVWFHINTVVDLENNTCIAPKYSIHADRIVDASREFTDYTEALNYYIEISKPSKS